MIPCPVNSFILFCSIEVTWLFNANCAKLWFVGSLAWRWTQIPKDLISAIICNKTAWKIIRSIPSVVKLLLDCCGSFAALLFRRNCTSMGAQFSTGHLLIYWKGNQVCNALVSFPGSLGFKQGWAGIPVSRDSREYKPQISLPVAFCNFPSRSREKEVLAGN